MSILGGEGFSLPVVTETPIVEVDLQFSDSAKKALKENMNGDELDVITITLDDPTSPQEQDGDDDEPIIMTEGRKKRKS